MVAALPPCPAIAQSASEFMRGWLNQDTMTGDWGGVRPRLEEAGISPRLHYTTESAYNPSGGRSQAARYTQQVDFGVDLDLERLAHIPDGQVKITFTDRRGRSLSADALGDNRFAVQELYGGGQTFRVVELHYEQQLLNHHLLLDIGWEPLGSNFATSQIYCSYFQTLATCGTQQLDNFDWQNWPFAQWGARVRFQPAPEYYVSGGVYQTNPRHAIDGTNLGFAGTGIIAPFEIGWLPGHHRGGLPGEYKVGGYYDSSRTSDVFEDVNGQPAGLTGMPFAQHNGRWGIYALATQMVYRESQSEKRGLTLFAMATTSDPRTETFRFFYAGAAYQGTFNGRDDDFVALLFAHGQFNRWLSSYQEDRNRMIPGVVGVQRYENVVELDYGVQIAPWLKLRPNLQYVIHPGGTGNVPDALVIGLFSCVTF
jgi:porin